MREIEDAAEANLISKRTLKRAKADLGVIATETGVDGGWTWELPKTKTLSPAD